MVAPRPLATSLSAVMLLSTCKSTPTANNSAGAGSSSGNYDSSCFQGAVLGAAAVALADYLKNKGSGGKAVIAKDAAIGAAAGCVIGLASTAVGKMMDARQQQKHDEAIQAEAYRRAVEQQNYAATHQRVQAMPQATNAQRSARDYALQRARAQYEASLARPTTVDLGNGSQSLIQVDLAAAGAQGSGGAAPAATGRPASWQDHSVLVNTPAGRARQYETWCPDPQGKMVRMEVREAKA